VADDNHFGDAVERYRDYLRRFIRIHMDRRMVSRVDPSDVIQQASLELVRQASTVDGSQPNASRVLLRRKALQVLVDFFRKYVLAQKRTACSEIPLHSSHGSEIADLKDGLPLERLAKRELVDEMMTAMARMDGADQEILRLRHLEGLSNATTAELLGISPNAARKRYGRAILHMRDTLRVKSD
jgi:RNA polymerase sigma-70 factor, ECF subfamily